MKKYYAQKRYAFTLAEVLITLMVIGVLAVVTIPSLVQSWEERATVSQLRKTYAALQQAFKLADLENGPVETAYNNVTEYAQAMIKYLPVVKDCKTQPTGCAGKYKGLNGNNYSSTQEYYDVEGYPSYYKVLLKDGVGVYLGFTSGCKDSYSGPYYAGKSCNLLVIDINGPKPPNIMGKDLFFLNTTTEGIIPSGGSGTSYCHTSHNASCRNATSYNGFGCARWVIERGNMEYLHKDTTW